ncbi:diguanylate cyclase [Halomonas janggokensis]|uniref:diguanylate cyclase n=1 Tax=Vreelandella janggokensis TaxID=370767 RepID=A0ABT4ISU2_9GAMM|nr:diguanylate cyclase [Halomonas janggokensis]MCZ0926717.1 diguanylate cyclase [Halomonas janggokensis]MCZ0929255.1 diguanylate cyclase [Halomonas janggokensis]
MADPTSSQAFAQRLKALSEAYSKRLDADFERLQALVEQTIKDPSCLDALHQIHSVLHSLAGSAGTFGFERLGRQAREYERQINGLLKQESIQSLPTREWVTQLQDTLEADKRQKAVVGLETTRQDDVDGEPAIWLVERDPMLAEYMAQQLHSFGFQVRHFSDAQDLAEVDDASPDLLLIDHRGTRHPAIKTNPVDFWLSQLSRYSCPVLFTGSEESFTARLQALRSGGQNYFAKPLDMIKLASHIAQLIKTKDSQPERVIIVEDDVELSQHLACVLEEAGMQVNVFDHPEAFFDALNDINPELILMDLWLPGITGAEIAALLGQMERWSQLPIVYLSAEPDAELRGQALLKGGDAFLEKPIDTDLLVSLCRSRVVRLRRLEQTKTRDALTGLLKHASIKGALQDQWQLAQRKPQTFCVVMLDIDHFKAVNDTYGHAVGDLVIAAVGTLLRQRFRSTDKLGRYGGEEFTLVLIDCTADHAVNMVNSLREDFSAIQFTGGGEPFACTLSAGVVDNQDFPDDTAESLLNRADQALYQAKNSGRNRTCLASETQRE